MRQATRPGSGDLASMLAARQKKLKDAEENDDGFYFND
jgi:hypothetical protein